MQLTKDDIEWNGIQYISLYKFQQVVAFYEKYFYEPDKLLKDSPIDKEAREFYEYLNERELLNLYEKNGEPRVRIQSMHNFNKALSTYCFVEGLK